MCGSSLDFDCYRFVVCLHRYIQRLLARLARLGLLGGLLVALGSLGWRCIALGWEVCRVWKMEMMKSFLVVVLGGIVCLRLCVVGRLKCCSLVGCIWKRTWRGRSCWEYS